MKHTLSTLVIASSLALMLSACASQPGNAQPPSGDQANRSWSTYLDDQAIENKFSDALLKASTEFRTGRYIIESYNGIVLIAGQVPSESARQVANEVINTIPKARILYNELTVGEPIGMIVRSNDGLLTTKVKARLLTVPGADTAKVNVITENGVVYLMGTVTRAESDRIVEAVQKTQGVQRIVKMFEYFD